jgi:hypothetical protein
MLPGSPIEVVGRGTKDSGGLFMKNLVADRTDIQGHRTGAFGGESVSGKGHPALRDDLPHQRGREEPGPPSTARTASASPVGPPLAELAESGDRAVAFSTLVERPWFRCPSSPDRRNDVARHRVVACALAQAVALIIVAVSMPSGRVPRRRRDRRRNRRCRAPHRMGSLPRRAADAPGRGLRLPPRARGAATPAPAPSRWRSRSSAPSSRPGRLRSSAAKRSGV